MMNRRQRGLLFLGIGVFFTFVFLVGGGVITSTDGGYWTEIFGVGVALGLATAGPWVYRSVKATPETGNNSTLTKVRYLASALIVGLVFPLSLAFMRSDLLSSNGVQHAFMIGMGFCLAQFAPLGLGFMRAHAEQSHALEPAAGPVSNGKLPPPAQ